MRCVNLAITISLLVTVAAAPLPRDDPSVPSSVPTSAPSSVAPSTTSPVTFPSAVASSAARSANGPASTRRPAYAYATHWSSVDNSSPWGRTGDTRNGFPLHILLPIIGAIAGLVIFGLIIKFCCIGTAAVAASRAYRPPPRQPYNSYNTYPTTSYRATQPPTDNTLLYSGSAPQYTMSGQASHMNPPPPYAAPPAYPEPVSRYG